MPATSCAFCTGSGAGLRAMSAGSSIFWRDDEVVVDRDGIPYYTGVKPELTKECRRRVLFAFQSLEGDRDTEEKERRDLSKKKKKKAFAKRLLNGLHGEAWKACQELITDMAKLSEEQGYKHVLACLQSIEKLAVKKTEQFDRFFEKGFRRRGQALDQYLRFRRQDWSDLQDLDSATSMSSDLLADFVLKHSGRSKDDRRQILVNTGSNYHPDSIEKAMRVSFHDYHEREKASKPDDRKPKGYGKGKRYYAHMVDDEEALDEEDVPEYDPGSAYAQMDEYDSIAEYDQASEYDKTSACDQGGQTESCDADPPSDFGASGDDEVFQAFATMDRQRKTYQDSRRRHREVRHAWLCSWCISWHCKRQEGGQERDPVERFG